MGMFGYMTDTETVEPLDTLDVESEGESTDGPNRPFLHQYQSFCSQMTGAKLCILFSFLKGDDMESLLFHFLDDWLYKFSAELFFVPRVSILVSSHL